jgi:hypothetical protein
MYDPGRAEHVSCGSLGRPARDCDHSALATGARHLVGGPLVPRSEHVPERGEDAVERIVRERQLLGISLDPFDIDAFSRGLLAATVEQLRNEVEAGHASAGASGGDGRVAGTAGDVEDVHAGLDSGARDDELADVGNVRRKRRVVAGGPHRALALLELLHRASFAGRSQGEPIAPMKG